jgi:nitrogenase molybdenum-iron protein NifN
VTTTPSPLLEDVRAVEVLIGDLQDLEERAAGCDLLVTHSHGRQASERLKIPLFRVGIPIFDRLGAAHQLSVGYRGTMRLIFEVANIFLTNPSGHSLHHKGASHGGDPIAAEDACRSAGQPR